METTANKIPSVSVVIPTADRQDLLITSVASALSQSFIAFEIIVVDNGNQAIDKSDFLKDVYVIRTAPRIGPGRARNIGAGAARGDYIAFLDDDDLWEYDYLEKVVQCICNKDAQVVLGRLMQRRADTVLHDYKLISDNSKHQRRVFYSNPGIVGTNLTIKREVFLAFSGFDETMPSSEDRDLLARMLLAQIQVVPETHAVAILYDHVGERAHHNIIIGNWMFIKKHWRSMKVREFYLALRMLLLRLFYMKMNSWRNG